MRARGMLLGVLLAFAQSRAAETLKVEVRGLASSLSLKGGAKSADLRKNVLSKIGRAHV